MFLLEIRSIGYTQWPGILTQSLQGNLPGFARYFTVTSVGDMIGGYMLNHIGFKRDFLIKMIIKFCHEQPPGSCG